MSLEDCFHFRQSSATSFLHTEFRPEGLLYSAGSTGFSVSGRHLGMRIDEPYTPTSIQRLSVVFSL